MRLKLLSTLVAFSFCRVASAADADLLRVYPASEKPDDPRYVAHGVDNPADFVGRYTDKAAWTERAEFLRRQVLVANGLWPMPEKTPLNAVIHGKIDRDEYTVEKVYFASMPGHYVTGNLYRPKKLTGKVPAVLCPHGHWPNGRFMWASDATAKKEIAAGAEQTIDGAHSPLQARCAMLARMGCVVFHYDLIGYADSNKLTHRQGLTDVESVLRLQSQMGMQTWNSIRAVDFIESLPEVDSSRIGCTGASGGGSQTFILGAVEPRITAAFPAVMVGMNMQGGCVCENAPLLRVGTNNVEIAALFAPRPLAMSAANDWTKDLETRGLPELKWIYKLYKAEDLVAAKHFSFPHNYNQVSRQYMYAWFNKHLKLGYPAAADGSVAEKPFTPLTPAELSVWDEKHPVPADALENAPLRLKMTEASDAKLAELAKTPVEYKKVLAGALEAMIVDRYPGPKGVRLARHSGPMRKGEITVERGAIERISDGTKVPFVAGIPDGWNGKVAIWLTEKGKQSILTEAGEPTPELAQLIEAKVAVVVPDLYWTGEFVTDGKASPPGAQDYAPKSNPPYAAFNLGYNRSVLGNRVHDVLSVVALVRGWEGTQGVGVFAPGKTGPVALLAKAAAGSAIDRVAADLGGFDFDQVKTPNDEMLLPGALKYGGIYGFAPLCDTGEVGLINAKVQGKFDLAKAMPNFTIVNEGKTTLEMLEWLLK